MVKLYKEIINSIDNHQTTMVEQLHQFCEINSGTTNLTGLAIMAETLCSAFKPIADSTELIKLPPLSVIDMTGSTVTQSCGDALFISKRPHLKRRILLSGHMDTVYSASNPFQKLSYLDANQINGPGVADMKGGLIVILHA
ncbi:TPA: carboxypeptidase, partial [Legionella pneumophila]